MINEFFTRLANVQVPGPVLVDPTFIQRLSFTPAAAALRRLFFGASPTPRFAQMRALQLWSLVRSDSLLNGYLALFDRRVVYPAPGIAFPEEVSAYVITGPVGINVIGRPAGSDDLGHNSGIFTVNGAETEAGTFYAVSIQDTTRYWKAETPAARLPLIGRYNTNLTVLLDGGTELAQVSTEEAYAQALAGPHDATRFQIQYAAPLNRDVAQLSERAIPVPAVAAPELMDLVRNGETDVRRVGAAAILLALNAKEHDAV